MLAFRPNDEKNPADDFEDVGEAIVLTDDVEDADALPGARGTAIGAG